MLSRWARLDRVASIYLRSVPETASILGWETGVDEAHLEERQRFFSIWVSRTLGMDTSEEFARYLCFAGFAGKFLIRQRHGCDNPN